MLASSAPYLAVIDGDLQHDERLLPEMLKTLKCEKLDLVIGSRYCQRRWDWRMGSQPRGDEQFRDALGTTGRTGTAHPTR